MIQLLSVRLKAMPHRHQQQAVRVINGLKSRHGQTAVTRGCVCDLNRKIECRLIVLSQ